MKKRLILSILFVSVSVLAGSYSDVLVDTNQSVANAAPSSGLKEVTGWMWSSNIGWISLNCKNTSTCSNNGGIDYGVMQATDGTFSGYGWNQNLGWLSFNAGCPNWAAGTCNAKQENNEIKGWAQFTNGTINGNEWDGWVSFSSLNDHSALNSGLQTSALSTYGSTVDSTVPGTTASMKGYAWGSTVVGWILVLGEIEKDPTPTNNHLFLKPTLNSDPLLTGATAQAAPNTIFVGSSTGTVRLTWYKTADAPNYTSCKVKADPTGTTWEPYTVTPTMLKEVPTQNPLNAQFTLSPSMTDTQMYELSCEHDKGTDIANAYVKKAKGCFITKFQWDRPYYCPKGTPGYSVPGISWVSVNTQTCKGTGAFNLTPPSINNYTSGHQVVNATSGDYGLICAGNDKEECEAKPTLLLELLDPKDPRCEKSSLPQCSDGIDNDGDGFIDFPEDPQCTDALDNSEKGGKRTIIKEV